MQFAEFFDCAQNYSTLHMEGTEDKYIQSEDIKKNPQALFNVVMGKHMIGTPISNLRFWVYVCKNGKTVDDGIWKIVSSDSNYSDKITEEYTEKIAKLLANS